MTKQDICRIGRVSGIGKLIDYDSKTLRNYRPAFFL